MSTPTRSSVRTYGRVARPVVAEAIEGRQLFAAAPPSHGFGPPHGRFDALRAEITVMMTAVALARFAAVAEAAAAPLSTTPSAESGQSVTSAGPTPAPGPAAARGAASHVNRAVPVAVVAAKAEPLAVRHADADETAQTPATPPDAAADAPDAPADVTFGPFNVTSPMAATTATEPKLTWTAPAPSPLLRPDTTPAIAARPATAGAKPVGTLPVDGPVADAGVIQQAALGLPAEPAADRPLWQRISTAAAGVTLVAVNYVVRRRRRRSAAAALR